MRIHSVRLPGFNAHQEVLFGSFGQVLSIRHDALGRDAYLPGVALAVREVPKRVGLVRGLDTLMGLQAVSRQLSAIRMGFVYGQRKLNADG